MSRFFLHYQDHMFDLTQSHSYPWDDWNYTDYFYFDTPEVSARFRDVSFLGCRGFVIAAAEVLAIRMSMQADVGPALAYLDAAWMSMLEDGICDYAVLAQSDWQGPFLGPLRAAMLIVNDTLFEAVVDGDIRARCSFIHNLMIHVLEGSQLAAYKMWMEASLLRLVSDFPDVPVASDLFQATVPLGKPCAPETFIVEERTFPEQCEQLLKLHRSRISEDNQWLRETPLYGIVG